MVVNPRSLTFGVEVEFTRVTRRIAANLVAEFFDTIPKYRGGTYDVYEIRDNCDRVWKIVRDSSITPEMLVGRKVDIGTDEYKCELVSPILNYSDIELLQCLIRDLRERGQAKVNESTGLHIHVGSDKFTANSLRILCNIIYSKQNLLGAALRVNHIRKRYCSDLTEDFIRKLNKVKPKTLEEFADIWYGDASTSRNARNNRYHHSRYQVLNLHNLLRGKYNAVEFRIFNGTLHAGKIKAFIQLVLLIVAQSLNQKKASYKVTVTNNPKYTFRVWLLKMGGIGDEFKTMRYHLLKHIEGNSAYKNKVTNEMVEDYSHIF
ncbi:hypothetical protein B9L19_03505 [Geobacillus thermocatenulatus]|uniref:Uncharacterized protein n=1 Tax=Geobacillus thermocatenulatus TaxID=33938 RepID=A0A226QCC0_9BACL|nr:MULTISPECIES: amidoligase family protein [Geobacillus thermoleovorans group]ASS98398.1 hypothetical protein GT3921_04640 [Geobacillus thermocatenulatus]MED4974252.1 amidoligase family protein [Geobacillus thermoleovorans]OXB89160.1 hypothetical protein B9L19_03505 [Geobacillus thermocatenulatus]QCK84027.1 amidoligase [Geobacillus kaustophilus NBRC 102445]